MQSGYIDSVINDDIKKILEKGCKVSLDSFKDENRIQNRDGEGFNEDNQATPL